MRARPALGACAAAPSHAVNMLTDEQLQYSRHADTASMLQLCGCQCHATLEVVWHSLTALISRPQLAPEPAGQSPRVVGFCVVGCTGVPGKFRYTFHPFWGSFYYLSC